MKNLSKKLIYLSTMTCSMQLAYAGPNFYINTVNSNDKIEIFATSNYGDSSNNYHNSNGYEVDTSVEVSQSGNTTKIRLEEELSKHKSMTDDFNSRFNTTDEFVLNSKNTQPKGLDADITLGMKINGSSVKGSGNPDANNNYIDGLTIAGEHSDHHNWAVASPSGLVYAENSKDHLNWGLEIYTVDGNTYCLKDIGSKNSVNLVDGTCANAQNFDLGSMKSANIKFDLEQVDATE